MNTHNGYNHNHNNNSPFDNTIGIQPLISTPLCSKRLLLIKISLQYLLRGELQVM